MATHGEFKRSLRIISIELFPFLDLTFVKFPRIAYLENFSQNIIDYLKTYERSTEEPCLRV